MTRKKLIVHLAAAMVALAGGACVIVEAFGPHCYWFNILYLCCILPACSALLVETAGRYSGEI